MKIKLLAVLLFSAILYLIASFVAMDFNPKNWDSFGRGFLAVIVICMIYSVLIKEDK